MKTIKILWVDDKFLDPDASFTKRVKEDIDECQDCDNTIYVDMVSNREDFLKKLSSFDRTKYAAIILDAETADNINDSPDINTFNLHLKPVDDLNYKVMKYVYSSFPDQVKKMALQYGFDVKDKNDYEPYDLLCEIKQRIEFEFPIVPEIMMSIREGFISSTNENRILNIIQSYYDPCRIPLEDMRYILEHIFKNLEKMRIVNFKALKSNGLSGYVDYLLHGGSINDTKKSYVPYNVCPLEVRYAIQCLEPCTQLFHHSEDFAWQRMPNKMFENHYFIFFKEMAYNAFFITIKWYYRFKLNEKSNPSNENFSNKQKLYYE